MEDPFSTSKVMSVGELRRYVKDNRLTHIQFSSDNQPHIAVGSPMKFQLEFTSMAVATNPNAVCLKNESGSMWIERVKHVIVDACRSPLGTVLDVMCADVTGDDIHYILVVT